MSAASLGDRHSTSGGLEPDTVSFTLQVHTASDPTWKSKVPAPL
jgi:hypothetical protein